MREPCPHSSRQLLCSGWQPGSRVPQGHVTGLQGPLGPGWLSSQWLTLVLSGQNETKMASDQVGKLNMGGRAQGSGKDVSHAFGTFASHKLSLAWSTDGFQDKGTYEKHWSHCSLWDLNLLQNVSSVTVRDVTEDKPPKISKPQFPDIVKWDGDIVMTLMRFLWGCNENVLSTVQGM